MDPDRWLTVRRAQHLLGEGETTVRRRITGGSLSAQTRRIRGREVAEVEADAVWRLRQEKLAMLGVSVDPLAPRPPVPEPLPGAEPPQRPAAVQAALARMTAERDALAAELRRVSGALEAMFAADDAQDDRVRAAEAQIRAAEERVRVAEERADLLRGTARSMLR
jgi:hypothetical protein